MPRGNQTEILPDIPARTQPGSLHHRDARLAFATVAIRGERVIPRWDRDPPAVRNHDGAIEIFWRYVTHCLHLNRIVPVAYFHLYLAEVSWRFDHRHEDPRPPLQKRLKTLSMTEIRPLLVRKDWE